MTTITTQTISYHLLVEQTSHSNQTPSTHEPFIFQNDQVVPPPKDFSSFPPLQKAIFLNEDYLVEPLLEKGVNLNAAFPNGEKPLHIASRMGFRGIIQRLIEKGAEVNGKEGSLDATPLHFAVDSSQRNSIWTLLRYGARPNARTKNLLTPLHLAAAHGQIETCNWLLRIPGLEKNPVDENLWTPLFAAIAWEHPEIAELLVSTKEVAVDNHDIHGTTPLHLAATKGYTILTELLLSKNAAIDPLTNHDFTPLCLAIIYNHPEIVKILLAKGANPNKKNKELLTPLHFAAKYGNLSACQVLCSHPEIEPYPLCSLGQTPLHLALLYNQDQVISSFLKDDRIQKSIRDNPSSATLLLSKNLPDSILLKQTLFLFTDEFLTQNENLIEKEALESPKEIGFTPLHRAAMEGNTPMCQRLLAHKLIDPNAVDQGGQTPLNLALLNNHAPIVSLFLDDERICSDVKNDPTPSTLLVSTYFNDRLLLKKLLNLFPTQFLKTPFNEFGQTYLHLAAARGCLPLIDFYLYGEGMEIKQQLQEFKNNSFTGMGVKYQLEDFIDLNGVTPLHCAARHGHILIVKLFLSQKKYLAWNIPDQDGATPESLARKVRNTEMIKCIKNGLASLKRLKSCPNLVASSSDLLEESQSKLARRRSLPSLTPEFEENY